MYTIGILRVPVVEQFIVKVPRTSQNSHFLKFTVSLLKRTKTSVHSLTPSTQWKDFKKVYIPFVLDYKISFGFNTKSTKCVWRKYQRKLLPVICLQNTCMCIVTCVFFVVTTNTLLFFLNGFCIAAQVFSYYKQQTRYFYMIYRMV